MIWGTVRADFVHVGGTSPENVDPLFMSLSPLNGSTTTAEAAALPTGSLDSTTKFGVQSTEWLILAGSTRITGWWRTGFLSHRQGAILAHERVGQLNPQPGQHGDARTTAACLDAGSRRMIH